MKPRIKPTRHAKALDVMAKAKNYNTWIYGEIKDAVGDVVLEIGCGFGNFTEYLQNVKRLVCVDLLHSCIDKVKSRMGEPEHITYLQGDFMQAATLAKLQPISFDTVVCLNVLEHIECDLEALQKMHGLLCPRGKLIIMVPAMPGLYGSMDKRLGHFRRYDRAGIEKKLRAAGFTKFTVYYFNSLGVLGWFINGRFLRRNNLSLVQTLFYDRIAIPIIAKLEKRFKPSFGMSILAVVEK